MTHGEKQTPIIYLIIFLHKPRFKRYYGFLLQPELSFTFFSSPEFPFGVESQSVTMIQPNFRTQNMKQ